MTLGALVDAGVPLAAIQGRRSNRWARRAAGWWPPKSSGTAFAPCRSTVEHEPEHAHRHLHHITDMIDAQPVDRSAKGVGQADIHPAGRGRGQSSWHDLRKVHFHEVGAVDSIADIVGAAIGWDLLGVERRRASPVPTGRWHDRNCPRPVQRAGSRDGRIVAGHSAGRSRSRAELTTPTGAAIVATLVESFGPLPAMRIERSAMAPAARSGRAGRICCGCWSARRPMPAAVAARDQVWVLETNLDDVSGEMIGYCTTRLLASRRAGVYTTAIQMKKNRPGVTLTVLCPRPERVEEMEAILFRETGTLGVRRWPVQPAQARARPHRVETRGDRSKASSRRVSRQGASFFARVRSCSRIAASTDVPLKDVYEAAHKAFAAQS